MVPSSPPRYNYGQRGWADMIGTQGRFHSYGLAVEKSVSGWGTYPIRFIPKKILKVGREADLQRAYCLAKLVSPDTQERNKYSKAISFNDTEIYCFTVLLNQTN